MLVWWCLRWCCLAYGGGVGGCDVVGGEGGGGDAVDPATVEIVVVGPAVVVVVVISCNCRFCCRCRSYHHNECHIISCRQQCI